MRFLVSLCLISAWGQAAPPQFTPSASDKQELYRMLDEIRSKIRSDDWSDAWRQSVRLHNTLSRYTGARASPQLELAHLEMTAGKDAISRSPLLARMAKTALAAGDRAKAERYANEALEASQHGVFPWTGDAIHQGNIVLGRLRLERNDVEGAKRFLLLAGKTPGSAALSSTGPKYGVGAGPAAERRIGGGAPVSGGMRRILGREPRQARGMGRADSRGTEAGFRRERGLLNEIAHN